MTVRHSDEPQPPGQASPVRLGSSAPVSLYDIDPDTVAALVGSCPSVAGLSAGPFGAAATYLPGRKVPGVQISPTAVEVHVIARYGIPVQVLAEQVRQVLAGRVLGRAVDIVVEDLEDPPAVAPATPATGTPPPAATGYLPMVAGTGLDVGWPPATLLPPPGPR